MASGTTGGIRIAIAWKSQKDVRVRVRPSMSRMCGGKKRARSRVSRNVFRRRCPRYDEGQTVWKTVKSSTTLLHLSGSISPATDTLDCHYLFLHARICVGGALSPLVSLASFILPDHAALYSLLVHCLPLLLPKGDCCCGFLSRYVPRIRSSRFYLASDPFVTGICFDFPFFPLFFFFV